MRRQKGADGKLGKNTYYLQLHRGSVRRLVCLSLRNLLVLSSTADLIIEIFQRKPPVVASCTEYSALFSANSSFVLTYYCEREREREVSIVPIVLLYRDINMREEISLITRPILSIFLLFSHFNISESRHF